ncbi:MAG: protein phosphatase 2C domain-containing protein [bacterium]
MLDKFEVASGSVRGRDHRETDKNNQDGFYIASACDALCAVVTDGCGSGKYSEVGAKIGARLVTEAIMREIEQSIRRGIIPNPVNEKVRQNVIAQLRILINAMGASVSEIVNDYFLFTIVGFLILPWETYIFSIGDGVFITNGNIVKLAFANNAPPYISYGITGSSLKDEKLNLLHFQIHEIIPTENVESILIGTDGVGDLILAEVKNISGKVELVGNINQFFKEDKFFKNPDMIRRRLSLINRDAVKYERDQHGRIIDIKKEFGLLPDDTTIVAVRRKRR